MGVGAISNTNGTNTSLRSYKRSECIVFHKTNERFGGLSNMAPGFPLFVNGLRIGTSEVLYQACRFPHMPEVQELLLRERSPITAKMRSKPYREQSRPDWERVRVKIMRWCLRVKLAQNWDKFARLLEDTGDRPIVEFSRKDAFWGAQPEGEETLVGSNILGRLLMELREQLRGPQREQLRLIEPPDIPNLLLLGRPIKLLQKLSPAQQEAFPPPNLRVIISSQDDMEMASRWEAVEPSSQIRRLLEELSRHVSIEGLEMKIRARPRNDSDPSELRASLRKAGFEIP